MTIIHFIYLIVRNTTFQKKIVRNTNVCIPLTDGGKSLDYVKM